PLKEYERALVRIADILTLLSHPLSLNEKKEKHTEILLKPDMEKEEFLKRVNRCQQYISQGEIIQVVISQKFTARTEASPFEIYQKLRVINPSPYLFFLDFDNFSLIGSSPEVMVKVQNKELLTRPIAGTRKRGVSLADDHQLASSLLADPKERAEHIMLVDLARNDLGRVARPGSVEVIDFMSVEKYSHVMHLVSTVKAELDEKYDVFDVIKAAFPAGTLTGAPKIRAMEIISEMEKSRRGPYGGMVFYLGFNGNFDSCITIRTILLKDGQATIQAGAGIVADSVAEKEYEETINKAAALFKTLEDAD
ncbi:MAG TPA: anthranilate synthase component I family protein, partial [Candidatus Saccharicenans sp.]|nr:anthranilate synthase component I family protein [Candidatus Saccharicenans sp.]